MRKSALILGGFAVSVIITVPLLTSAGDGDSAIGRPLPFPSSSSPPIPPVKGSKLSSAVAAVTDAVEQIPADTVITAQYLTSAYASTKPLFENGLLHLDAANRLQVYLRVSLGADLEALSTELSAAGVVIERVAPEGDIIQAAVGMVDNRKVHKVVIDGAPHVDYVEIEGDFSCDVRTDGARRPFRVLVARVNMLEGFPWTLVLIGPKDTVTERRDMFLKIVQSIRP